MRLSFNFQNLAENAIFKKRNKKKTASAVFNFSSQIVFANYRLEAMREPRRPLHDS